MLSMSFTRLKFSRNTKSQTFCSFSNKSRKAHENYCLCGLVAFHVTWSGSQALFSREADGLQILMWKGEGITHLWDNWKVQKRWLYALNGTSRSGNLIMFGVESPHQKRWPTTNFFSTSNFDISKFMLKHFAVKIRDRKFCFHKNFLIFLHQL